MSQPQSGHESAAERDRYFERVERHFGVRRGGPVILSPRDWQLLDAWFDRGIPLRAVLRGINEAFDRFDAGTTRRRINSLSYCTQQVEAAWDQDRQPGATDGGEASTSIGSAATHLRRCATICLELVDAIPSVGDALRAAAAELEALASGEAAVGRIDAEASAIEQRLRLDLERAGQATRLPRFSPWAV